jgi:ATP-dependent Clp protease protease subunit
MRLSPNPIVTIGVGEVHSIATLLMQGGKTRLLTPHTRMMVHNISVGLDGVLNNDQLHVTTKEISVLSQVYAETMAGATKQTVEAIKTMCRKETYMSAIEAVDAGFADGIIQGSHFAGEKVKGSAPEPAVKKAPAKKKAKAPAKKAKK